MGADDRSSGPWHACRGLLLSRRPASGVALGPTDIGNVFAVGTAEAWKSKPF
ncbi:hypothetical protein BJ973_009638 [Actinoplanes tereljensis]